MRKWNTWLSAKDTAEDVIYRFGMSKPSMCRNSIIWSVLITDNRKCYKEMQRQIGIAKERFQKMSKVLRNKKQTKSHARLLCNNIIEIFKMIRLTLSIP